MAALADADQSTRLAGRNRLERAREYFEPYLDDMGLSISKLDQQTTDQLRDSLEKINQLIARPESLGVFREAFALLMASTETQVTALPALLQRKGYIIEKLREKGEEEKLVTLRDVIQKSVMNVEFKQEIETQLEALEKNTQKLSEESNDLVQRQNMLLVERERYLMQIEGLERRSRVWLSFLEKESASTLIGAVILSLITVCLIISLFIGRDTMQVLSNGFLVILGYFFGQASRRPVTTERGTSVS